MIAIIMLGVFSVLIIMKIPMAIALGLSSIVGLYVSQHSQDLENRKSLS